MSVPTIVIVGADKGGVGKTTVTRALLEYLDQTKTPVRVFDTESPSGDLKRFYPGAKVIDISKVQSQMEVFDVMPDSPLTIVDLRAGMFSQILKELDDAKLLADVRSGALNLVLIHILGPTINSLAEITATAERIGGGAKHFLVKNHINDTTFFEWDGDPLKKMADITISVPQLAEIACETIQKVGCSFRDFTKDAAQSRMLRGKVVSWLQQVWKEFDRVKLLQSVKPSAPQ